VTGPASRVGSRPPRDVPGRVPGDVPALTRAAGLVRPVTLARERLLPVAAPLVPLLPQGGLLRGTVMTVEGEQGGSAMALALVAEASAEGAWIAVVGWPAMGVVAAGELGVALERLVVVEVEAERWGEAVAALLGAGKRDVSLVDHASFIIMRKLAVRTALTLDRHFAQQGFRVLPKL